MEPRKFISLIILVVFPALATAKECPEKYKKITPDHSFCKDPNPNCKVLKQGVGKDDIKVILDKHNEMRSKVASGKESGNGALPTASNMMEMEWDEELAAIAQSWALQCTSNHDCNDCRKVERFQVGQNFAGSSCLTKDSCKQNWSEPVGLWYKEKDKFNKNNIKSFKFNPDTGHFTQMIWATSAKIGCGYVAKESGNTAEKLHFCNYGPGGNIQGSPIYEEGKPCSKCPSGSSCSKSHPGLCSSNDNDEDDDEDGAYYDDGDYDAPVLIRNGL